MYQRDVESGAYYTQIGGVSSISGISSNSVRSGFVRKVYTLLSVQLLATTVIASPFVLMDQNVVQSFIYANVWLMWLSLAISFMVMMVFACFPDLMRQVPINYFLLALFTITEGFCVGIISSMYTTASVVLAFGIVTVVTLVLTVFAMTTELDFTKMWPYLLAFSVVMIVAGLVLIFVPSYIGTMVYAGLGAMLFSVYLVFDTQMIIGGKSEMQFSIDDYVPAAISLYIDIVQLFIYFLTLFGERRD